MPDTGVEQKAQPQGLGGWLILPAIGLFIMPIRMAFSFRNDFWPVFRDGHWALLTTPGSEAYHPYWEPLLLFELGGNALFVIFDFLLIALFFTRHHYFPRLYISFLVANIIFVSADYVLASRIPAMAVPTDPTAAREIMRALLGAAIWIPYFLVSKRVKNTFVKVHDSADGSRAPA